MTGVLDEFTRKIQPLTGTDHKTSVKRGAVKTMSFGTDFTRPYRNVILMHVYCAKINSPQPTGTLPLPDLMHHALTRLQLGLVEEQHDAGGGGVHAGVDMLHPAPVGGGFAGKAGSGWEEVEFVVVGLGELLIRPDLSVNHTAYFTRVSWKNFFTRSGDFSNVFMCSVAAAFSLDLVRTGTFV